MIDDKLKNVLNASINLARVSKHEYITLDHIFLILLKDKLITTILEDVGLDVVLIKSKIKEFLFKDMPKVEQKEPVETLSVSKSINNIVAKATSRGASFATTIDMFIEILNNKNTISYHVIQQFGLERIDFLEAVSHRDLEAEINLDNGEDKKKKRKTTLLENSIELVGLAKKGKIDPVIGRDKELERIIEILGRKKKNNPLLVGEAGVGKSAVVEGLALLIANEKAPTYLKNKKIYSLDISGVVAGTKYRGDFEKKLKTIIKEISKDKDAILFIDEIHQLIGAGSTGDSSMDASNILKPFLSSGKLRCIGATTYEEYKKDISKNKAFSRRFSKIDIVEPTIDEAIEILRGLKSEYEKFHKVRYNDDAIIECVTLAKKYINDRFLPDSAIDVLDESASAKKYNSKSKTIKITKTDIQKTLSKIANIPVKNATKSDINLVINLEKRLLQKIFGQDDVVKKVVNVIKLNKAGLGVENKPIGSFLFTGPTGVGKTEVAKELANELGIKFIRYDMSEYMESHTISKLIGSPAGYVGYERGGLLSEDIKKHPHCVLLFDEIEKAHSDIYNILLQILDYATLTDNSGEKINFKNVIIILTSNLGTKEAPTVGFTKQDSDRFDSAIKNFFSPEIRNRLDEILYFKPLEKNIVIKIVEKFIKDLQNQLKDKKIKITLTKKAKDELAILGYDKLMGARPLQKIIKEKIKLQLTEEILAGKLKSGGDVNIDFKDNDFKFIYKN